MDCVLPVKQHVSRLYSISPTARGHSLNSAPNVPAISLLQGIL
jgi:hypothetical protein